MIREEIIKKLIVGKRVLDIGSIGQSDEYCLWNSVITKYAEYARGVDLPDGVETLKEKFNLNCKGYCHANDNRIILANMESVAIGETFDIVTAGDVIEHVSNQGLFLDNIRRHLVNNGKLVITTPNAKWITVCLKPNVTHTLWHDIYTLMTLLDRHGFIVEYWRYYYGNKEKYNFIKKFLTFRQQILIIASVSKK